MQAVGMLRGTRAVYSLVILTTLIGYARPRPLQLLPSIPGYIPVYIRHGDEPLIEINPALAEAFHEDLPIPKSQPLDNTADIPSGSVEADNGFIEKSRKEDDYPEHVRLTAKDEGYKESAERDMDVGVSKILPLELHDFGNKHYSTEYHEEPKLGTVSKGAVVKVNPLSEAEKEELERFRIRIEKQEAQGDPRTELLAKESDGPKLSRDFVISLGDASADAKDESPRIRLVSVPSEASSDDDVPIPEEKMSVKLQPVDVPSNVHKLLRMDGPDEKTERGTMSKEETGGSREDKPEDYAGSDDKAN